MSVPAAAAAFVAPLSAIPLSATPLSAPPHAPASPHRAPPHSVSLRIRRPPRSSAVAHAERSAVACVRQSLPQSQSHPPSLPPSLPRPVGQQSARWRSMAPTHPERAPWEPSESPESSGLAWKDRVALYAQFSPSATLSALLDALRAGSRDDAGIEALYAFANVDVWQVAHRFFGRNMDLGQFERFKRVIVAPPYDVLLRHDDRHILAALTLGPAEYVARVRFTVPRRDPVVLTFHLTRGTLGAHTSWMVDSILHERPSSGERPAARGDPRPRSAA